ncbi:MAG: hypothetical protein V4591_12455 [Bdellovibrionota bacterium]
MYFKKILMPLFLFTLTSCGKNNENSATPSFSVQQDKIYFTTSDYGSRTGYLYSFSPVSNQVKAESPLLQQIDGLKGFQSRDGSGNLKNLYLAKYNMGQPSSVLAYNTEGTSTESQRNLPENIYDMMLANNSLYYVGYDKKEIAVSSSNLNSVTLASTTVQGFSKNSDTNNFVSILNNENNYYAVSVGYPYSSTIENQGAKIFTLSEDLTSTQGSPILIKNCFNLNSSMKISNSKLVVACNPTYTYPEVPGVPSIFLIDVSSNINPNVQLLKTVTSNINIYLGGVSVDGSYILVTEEENNGDYSNPTANSYWLNLNNQVHHSTYGGAYQVSYNKITNSYIFSCILNANNQCQSNAFGVALATTDNDSIQSNIATVSLSHFINLNGVHGVSFFKAL